MRLTLFWADNQSQNTSAIDTQSVNSQNIIEIPPYHNRDFTAKSTFDPVHLNQGLEPFQKAVKHRISSQPIRAPMTKNVTRTSLLKRLTEVHVSAFKIKQHIFKNACLN